MLQRLIDWLRGKLDEGKNQNASADIPADLAVSAVVRRFQGRYACGHPWPHDKLAPEACPIHGEGCERVYSEGEPVEFTHVRAKAV